MHSKKVIFWFVVYIFWCDGQNADIVEQIRDNRQEKYASSKNDASSRSSFSLLSDSISHVSHESDNCNDDIACLLMASNDRLGLEAIKQLHQQLDDDANGNVDLSESDDFLREELKYDSGYEKRQRAFHRNDDMHISVRELWEAWLKSEVHNWTVEQTSEWLAISVDLPQYVTNFQQHRVSGATLPRLAVNNMHYLNNVLGIKDPIHKQKIALKAMDVVLFGPPKDSTSLWKDMTLVTLLFGSIIGSWYTYLQRKKSRTHLHRMLKDMESLHKAELALEDLQKELERAKLAQENVVTEKQNLEKKLQEAGDGNSLRTSYSDLEVSQLKAEIEMLRTELQIAEGELKDRCWSPPLGLQQWLQLTHEIENKSYIKKKISAEKQLQQAREACEKLRKKRSSLVGAFVSTHGKSIDDVDRSIVEARTSLNEVTQELQERVYRWKQIELLCGFNIINNNGLPYLESILYRNINGRPGSNKGRMSNSQDDLDDETSSIYAPSATGCLDTGSQVSVWKDTADSSGSEASKHDDDSIATATAIAADIRHFNNVHFSVGGDMNNIWQTEDPPSIKPNRTQSQQPLQQLRTSSNNSINNNNMLRSQSHDANISTISTIIDAQVPKFTQIDGTMDATQHQLIKNLTARQQKILKDQATSALSLEEDVCSTDSSTVDEEVKRRRRKLFSGFSKKTKSKVID